MGFLSYDRGAPEHLERVYDDETKARFIYHSNRLDGITLSEPETRQILAGQVIGTLTAKDGKEYEADVVVGHRRAFDTMVSLSQETRPVSEDDVTGLHRALMSELLLSAGEYRECSLRYKGLLIASPPEHLQERVQWLVKLTNSGLERAKDAHKFSWRAHHEFITLHPFIEGNGRMARLLLNLVRLRRGLDLSIVPFEAREQYNHAIIEFQQQKIARAQEKKAQAGP